MQVGEIRSMRGLWFLWALVITVALIVTDVSVFRPGTRIQLNPGYVSPTPTPGQVYKKR